MYRRFYNNICFRGYLLLMVSIHGSGMLNLCFHTGVANQHNELYRNRYSFRL